MLASNSSGMQRQILLLGLIYTCLTSVFAAAPGRFVPDANCTTSLCHGGAGELREQHSIWSRKDMHARSYATLTTARSEQIMRALGGDDARTDTRCTTCHAPNHAVPAERFIKTPPDHKVGVSCQNCHGPAEHWLRSHTRRDYSHGQRVRAGLREVRSLYHRANACVACHQNVDQPLLKAGHPELIFELDGQTLAEPRHWIERRAPDYSPAEAWLVGQAIALREMAGKAARDQNPDPKFVDRWAALIWLLQPISEMDKELPSLAELRPDPRSASQQIAKIDAFAQAIEGGWRDFSEDALKKLAGSSADFAAAGPNPDQETIRRQARRAERLVLALDRLVSTFDQEKAANLDAEVQKLFDLSQSTRFFSPTAFAQQLDNLANALK